MFAKPALLLILASAFSCAVPAMADDIAVSLVHAQSRIDIPASAIERIEAFATQTFFNTDTKQNHEIPLPHVDLCYSVDIQRRVCRLTRRIIEQPMDIVIDCETLSKPVVREPSCGPCLQVSVNSYMDANALAQRLKMGSNRRCGPVS